LPQICGALLRGRWASGVQTFSSSRAAPCRRAVSARMSDE
jgi:hypothetical protein